MPHIQIDINRILRSDQKKNIFRHVVELFSTVMKTGQDHIAISIREFDKDNSYLGQVLNISNGKVLIDIDPRTGRISEQKEILKSKLIKACTLHTQNICGDFHLSNRNLDDWSL